MIKLCNNKYYSDSINFNLTKYIHFHLLKLVAFLINNLIHVE